MFTAIVSLISVMILGLIADILIRALLALEDAPWE